MLQVFKSCDANHAFPSSLPRVREHLANHRNPDQPLPDTLRVLPSTPQIRGLHTFVRNRETQRDEFIFYARRLIRLVIEYALSLLPFEDVEVETPQGVDYRGRRSSVSRICGVSILRAGETMEDALTEVCQDIRVGKILIQTSTDTGEPQLHYLRLPKDIKDYRQESRKVFLFVPINFHAQTLVLEQRANFRRLPPYAE